MEMRTKLFITGLALMAVTTLLSAQNSTTGQRQQNNCNAKCIAYVDANKNGICDNFENRTPSAANCKRNGYCKGCGQGQRNGQGRMSGKGQGSGRNFVDANKNGVCDYYEASVKK